MRTPAVAAVVALLLAACARPSAVSPSAFAFPDSVAAMDGRSDAPLSAEEVVRRIGATDIVLLGEVHDNPVDHALRARLITALASRHPAIVFEQFAESDRPLPPPARGDSLEAWLDRNGFDRTGWRWPLHRPVVDAALAQARSLWGSGVSRDRLRAVVREGDAAAPDELRRLMERAPLDSAGRAVLDAELVEGHCGQLPASLVPGMRSAQVVRDAAMARALALAAAGGPAWLIAGNGHVRRNVAVPRLLGAAAPGRSVLAVGLLERGADGAAPDTVERRRYDVVIVTPRTARPDPCAG